VTPERFARLRRWWASARSTVVTLTWEARFWAVIGIIGVFWKGLSTSIAAIFFMSAWALVRGASVQKHEAQREMLEEEADEADPDET
jgi:fatty acid desaturase